MESFFSDNNATYFLSSAFIWANANELGECNQKDHNFWSNLNQLWLKELEKDPS